MWLDLLRILGVQNEQSRWYALWSGFGGDIPIFVGVVVFLHHHRCHERRCWRPGHPTPAGAVQCRRHRQG